MSQDEKESCPPTQRRRSRSPPNPEREAAVRALDNLTEEEKDAHHGDRRDRALASQSVLAIGEFPVGGLIASQLQEMPFASRSETELDLKSFLAAQLAAQQTAMQEMVKAIQMIAQSTTAAFQNVPVAHAMPPQQASPQQRSENQPSMPSNVGQPSTSNPPIEKVEHTRRKLPDPIVQALDKEATHFEKEVKKYVSATMRCDKTKNLISDFENSADNLRYPNGVKPFKSPPEQETLDNVWNSCRDGDTEVSITIKKGSTIREAMKRIHWECSLMMKRLECESLIAYVEKLKLAAHVNTFKSTCMSTCAKATSSDSYEKLGLDKPLAEKIHQDLLDSKIQELYQRSVDRVKKKVEDDIQEREKWRRRSLRRSRSSWIRTQSSF